MPETQSQQNSTFAKLLRLLRTWQTEGRTGMTELHWKNGEVLHVHENQYIDLRKEPD